MNIKRAFARKEKDSCSTQANDACQANGQAHDPRLKQKVITAIRTVYDPEIHVNIYDLGLIYNIQINDRAEVAIDMTLTAPACPVAEILPAQVTSVVKQVPGINDVKVTLVWEPPWDPSAISEAARLELGLL